MNPLIKRIRDLSKLSEQLEPAAETRKRLNESIYNYTSDFIDRMEDNPAYQKSVVGYKHLAIDERPTDLNNILAIYTREVLNKGINPASGGHLGYIPGGGIYTSGIADFLAAISNEYAGIYFGSPGAVNIENEVLNWFKKIFEYPDSAVGNLASGGSIANLIALTSARDHHKILESDVSRSVVYMSSHTHHCIHKALRIIGLEKIILRNVDQDDNHRLDTEALRTLIDQDLAEGRKPFMVIASAGTTDTGAVDPLMEIGNIANSFNLWFHVDAAYGGFFKLLPEMKDLFQGIEMSDSLVIDPHKSLFMPYGVGAVLIKNKESVLHSHHYTANYMQDTLDSDSDLSPAELSPELTKHFRGLRVWLPLKYHGVEPFIACLREKILLTEYFRMKLKTMGFSLGPLPDLSVSYFWYPQKVGQDEFNRKLMEEIHKDGSVFLSSSTIDEKFVIRMAILAFRTKLETIDKALKMIERCLGRMESSNSFTQ